MKDEKTPQHWTLNECAEALRESDKADEIDDLIMDLRGTVFFKLKEMGKFTEDVEGPDAQICIDMIISRIMGAL